MSNYDPNKTYTWQNETQFTMSGAEFGTILNALRIVLSSEEAKKIILLQRANSTIEGILANEVNKGNIKEAELPQKEES